MAFWKGFGLGILSAGLTIAIASIITVSTGHAFGTAQTMLIMFLVFCAFNIGFVYYGAEEGFGRGTHIFFIIFSVIMFMFAIVGLTVGIEELSKEATTFDIAFTRIALIAAGLSFVSWYLMLGLGIAGNPIIVAVVPLIWSLVGFGISYGLTAANPIASLVVSIILGAGGIIGVIVLRVINGSVEDI